MQFSFAVKSSNTVAAGYFIEIRSFYGDMNKSTMSTMLLRYFERTKIPSAWQAQSSKILATDLYSVGSRGQCIMNLIRLLKMSALMKSKDNSSYISLSLNSRVISIIVPIKCYRSFFSEIIS